MTNRMSRFLPASLGSMFGQPLDKVEKRSTLPDPPANLPGAYASPELCCIVDQYVADHLQGDSIAEVKLDGIRCIYIAGRLWTREGSAFEAAEHCLPWLAAIEASYGRPMVFDGEYVEDGGLEATIAAFRRRKGNGVLWLFDAVPFDEWKSGQPSRKVLRARKVDLGLHLARATAGRRDVSVGFIDHRDVATPAEVEKAAQDLWALGYEGLVVKGAGTRYVRKRTADWMKVKLRTVSNMVITDVLGCKRKVEVVENGHRVQVEQDQAKALLVRHPCALGDRPGTSVRIAVPAGGLAATIWEKRIKLVGGTCQVEHAGFTGAGNPREAVLKSISA